MTVTPDWVSAVASSVSAVGVVLAFAQLRITRNIAQSQFEDGLSKEYRELASRIPTKALLGAALSDEEYECTFDEFFRYLDLSNEQVSLRQRSRVGVLVWQEWKSGIQSNLSLPAFERAWLEVQAKSSSFAELRRLQHEGFRSDPKSWREAPKGFLNESTLPSAYRARGSVQVGRWIAACTHGAVVSRIRRSPLVQPK